MLQRARPLAAVRGRRSGARDTDFQTGPSDWTAFIGVVVVVVEIAVVVVVACDGI